MYNVGGITMLKHVKTLFITLLLLFIFVVRVPRLYANSFFYSLCSPAFPCTSIYVNTEETLSPDLVYPGGGMRVKAYNFDIYGNPPWGPPNSTFMLVASRMWQTDSTVAYGWRCSDYSAAWTGGAPPGGVSGPGSDIWTYPPIPIATQGYGYVTTLHLADNHTSSPWWSGSADGIAYTSYPNGVFASATHWNGFRPYDGACDCPGRSPRRYYRPTRVSEVPPVCPN